MASLLRSGKYGAINTTDTAINGFYVFIFISEAYILQDNTKIYGQIITPGGSVFKSQYLCYMQEIINLFWGQHPQQKQ